MIKSILLTGVGGQGVLFSAGIIASAAESAGYNVTTNEIHGMAQRGGSVTAQVRFSDEEGELSPLALVGTVDVLGSMEQIEALRYAHWLKKGGAAVVAKTAVIPVTVTNGECSYPNDVEERLNQVFDHLVWLDCVEQALKMGNARLSNTILTGAMAKELPEIGIEHWRKGLLAKLKPGMEEMNLQAFMKGYEQCSNI